MSVTTSHAKRLGAYVPAMLALVAGFAALVLVFMPECRAAVRVWTDSTAYGHCYLVAPIVAYLVWDRRDTLHGLLPRPAASLALLGLPLPLAWFAAERLGIMEGRQLVAVAFLELLFLVVLGWQLFRALMGPLLYLFFLVPFGAFVTPVLQSFTAHFVNVGLSVLGISHFVTDMLIETSAGTFFVAEACAGLRFLIASIAFGVFYALLNYRSPARRAAFIAASIVVPIIANGFRALGIVVLGSILGSAEAAAADHLIYGWVFFSVVMLLLVAAGLPLREPPAPARIPGPLVPAYGVRSPWPVVVVLVIAAIAPGIAMAFDRAAPAARLAAELPIVPPEGCTLKPAAGRAPDRSSVGLACRAREWLVTVVSLSPRGTGSVLSDARAQMLGPIDPEESSTTTLPTDRALAGTWQVTVSSNPGHVTGVSAWVHGRAAPGGLSQRIVQARDSVLGNDVPPLLIAIGTRSAGRLPERDAEAAMAELGRIVAAQGDLAAKVAGLAGVR